jgi:hypothetical protein
MQYQPLGDIDLTDYPTFDVFAVIGKTLPNDREVNAIVDEAQTQIFTASRAYDWAQASKPLNTLGLAAKGETLGIPQDAVLPLLHLTSLRAKFLLICSQDSGLEDWYYDHFKTHAKKTMDWLVEAGLVQHEAKRYVITAAALPYLNKKK